MNSIALSCATSFLIVVIIIIVKPSAMYPGTSIPIMFCNTESFIYIIYCEEIKSNKMSTTCNSLEGLIKFFSCEIKLPFSMQ